MLLIRYINCLSFSKSLKKTFDYLLLASVQESRFLVIFTTSRLKIAIMIGHIYYMLDPAYFMDKVIAILSGCE